MGSPKTKTEAQGPVYDPQMQEYLNRLGASLDNQGMETQERISGDALYGSIQDDIQRIQGLQDQAAYRQSDRYVADVRERAAQYTDPRVVEQIQRQAQEGIEANIMGQTASQLGTGSADSSKSALAAGFAQAQGNQMMADSMLGYEQQNLNRAQADIDASFQQQAGLIGAGSSQQQYLRELLQGDANAAWSQNLIANNPDLMRAFIYSGVANTSPMGTLTQTTG